MTDLEIETAITKSFVAEFLKIQQAMVVVSEAAADAAHSMTAFHNQLELWRREWENSLTFSEMKQYLKLIDDHPDLGWLDIWATFES